MIPGTTSSQGKYVDPPTSVTASAGNAQATVSFTLPVYDGKGVATYVATSSPSGLTGSGASSPITVTGLANGTSYTFTVTTISGYGVSAISVASNAVSPVVPDPCAGSPAAGTVLSANYCSGTTLVRNVSDGCNGVTVQTVQSNSATCGYVEPPPPACSSCNNTLTNTEYTFTCEDYNGDSYIDYVERQYLTYGAPYSCEPAGCSPCSCPSVTVSIYQVHYNFCPD